MISAAAAAPAILSLDDLNSRERRKAMTWVSWSWVFGAVWATTIAGAPFTRFAAGLGARPIHFGLLVAMPFIATLLSLPASMWIDASGQRKRIFVAAMLTQRLTWLGIAILPTLILTQGGSPALALGAFLSLMAVHYMSGAIGGPAWVSWMADLVPDPIRGRYFARRRQLGILSSVPAAWLAGLVLDTFAQHGDARAAVIWSAVLFGVTSLAGLVDILCFLPVPHVPPRRSASAGSAWMTLLRPLKDKHFVWFCLYVATLTMAVAPMGQFTNLYLVDHLGIGSTQVQLMMLVAPLVGQFLIVPIWGKMADKYGRKPMMAISTFGLVPVGLGWCAMNLGYAWLGYALAVGGAMLWAAVEIANFNLVIAMSGSGDGASSGNRGSGFMSINSVICAIAGVGGGLGAGYLMSACKDVHFTLGLDVVRPFGAYEILFAASALLRLLAGLIFLPRLHEPDARPTREAIGFLSSNLYNNVTGIVRGPIRRLSRPIAMARARRAQLEAAETIKLPVADRQPASLRRAG
jgi:MFS family permease